MFPMVKIRTKTQPKKVNNQKINNKITTITLISKSMEGKQTPTLCLLQYIPKVLLKMRKKETDKVRGVMVAVQSISINRKMVPSQIMERLMLELMVLGYLIRTPPTLGRELEASILTQAHKLLEAQSTTSISRTQCKTFKTLNLPQVFAIRFKCKK